MGYLSRRKTPRQPEQLYTLYELRDQIEAINAHVFILPVKPEPGEDGTIAEYDFGGLCEMVRSHDFCPEHDARFCMHTGVHLGALCDAVRMYADGECPCRDERGRKCGERLYCDIWLPTDDWLDAYDARCEAKRLGKVTEQTFG